jgi:preprotein translocase subunit SecA
MVFNWIINKISWDYNEKALKSTHILVEQINKLSDERDSLDDDAIKAKTPAFKERIAAWASLDDILVEAFATVKQACKRMVWKDYEVKGEMVTWSMVPYDVQLIWWIVLHQSKIAEMRTWEWKTLVATLPAYLNALAGKWVHVVTVNDYLASRDAEWMGHLYAWLGLTVWSITKSVPLQQRRAIYEADITYVENSELWFDYLRDNLAKSVAERTMLWRPLNYAIIDEVDSILIDEARTPLIISQPSDEPTEKYVQYAQLIQFLVPSKNKKKVKQWFLKELLGDLKQDQQEEDDGWDYYIDEKTKSVTLSSNGIDKLEKLLKVDNIYKDLWYDEIHHIENALKANAVYKKDKDYLINHGEIVIVDENTGRTMPWRRYSEGLHQAIEAKEQVMIQRESKTLASITYQHFFKQYAKLSGMTGTALTEAEEFEKIYELEVITVPTNKPILRVDKNDNVYFNQNAKWNAVVEYINFYHKMWLPILIGTSTIHTSELMSQLLKKMTLQHTVLNAKFHEQEAMIVKNAWKQWSIVVATNMAWRGTDIKLEAWLNTIIAQNYARWVGKTIAAWWWVSLVVYSSLEYEWLLEALQQELGIQDEAFDKAIGNWVEHAWYRLKISMNTSKKIKEDPCAEVVIQPAQKESVELDEKDIHFGLFILWTEKHDSRRIDNQLRGRAWRQGDPWVSQFFVAMDDEIMRKMWWDKIQSVARLLLSQEQLETMAFTQSQFTNSIKKAQTQMEWWHFGIRKHLFDYDSVINKQRERIYAKRDQILEIAAATPSTTDETVIELDVLDEVKYFIDEVVDDLLQGYASSHQWNIPELLETLQSITWATFLEEEFTWYTTTASLWASLKEKLHDLFDAHIAWDRVEGSEPDPKRLDALKEYCKRVYLFSIDKNWMQHITDMQYLREKVWLFGYAQLDPLVIYKKESYYKFQTLLATIRKETLGQIMRADFSLLQWPQVVINPQQPKTINMADILKAVNEWLKKNPELIQQAQQQQEAYTKEQQAKRYNNTDDVEVIELDEDADTTPVWWADLSATKQKLRPNDKVSVRYADGRQEFDVKWKKVKESVESWSATLLP